MLLAFPGLSFGGVSALLLYCSLSLLTPKTFTPPRFTLPYAEALYLALRRSAFTLTSSHVPTFFFIFFFKQLVSQKLKMVTIDAILNHLLTIVET